MTAEFGKVKNVKLSDLQAGMKVHNDIIGRGGKVLVSAGETLTKKHVDQLNKWEQKPKPMGQALPKRDPKDPVERTRFSEFTGGWRPSDFNPRGVNVSSTLGSPYETPAVERDPTLSPVVQKSPQKSFAVGDAGVDSPLFRQRALESEIASLSSTNASLGGNVDPQAMLADAPEFVNGGEEKMVEIRDLLKADNERLIASLKAKQNVSDPAPARRTAKARKR